VGNIPEKLRIVCQAELELTKTIDGVERTVKVKPAFFQDIETKPDTALAWGTSRVETTPPDTPWGQKEWKTVEPEVSEEDNKPIHWLKFWCIDERAEGGRAFKVIDEKNRMFDMREDIVEEAIFAGEFNNGIFFGNYVWGKCHTQMRLVRLDSVLYKKLAEAGRRKNLKKIPNKDLEVGGVYQMKNGDRYVYLGRIPGKGASKGMKFARLRVRWREELSDDHQLEYDKSLEYAKEGWGVIEFRDSQAMVEKLGTVDTRGHEV
jgi:hypothetical protein